jgi:hypothetical protein
MRLRWPFCAAMAALVLGLIAWESAPAIADAWREHQQNQRSAAYAARLQRALDALSTMPDPLGTKACSPVHVRVTSELGLCWRGEASPHSTALAFKSTVIAAGATRADVRCRPLGAKQRRLTQCHVDGAIRGMTFQAWVIPNHTTQPVHRTSITVLLDVSWPPVGAWASVPIE